MSKVRPGFFGASPRIAPFVRMGAPTSKRVLISRRFAATHTLYMGIHASWTSCCDIRRV
jgi:hypothetical protein